MNELEKDAEADITRRVEAEIKQLKRKKGSAWKGSSNKGTPSDTPAIVPDNISDGDEEEALERAFIDNLTRIMRKQACERVL